MNDSWFMCRKLYVVINLGQERVLARFDRIDVT